MTRHSQRGIALVITLIMLAVVTVMAVVFLAISRRERTSVTVTADLTDAKLMADAALARGQAEIIARIAAGTNLFAYDLLVSTNFIQRTGFRPGVSSLTNVSYVYLSGLPLNNDNDIRQNLANLFYDPRPPVFVVTNANTGESEFRFYLDLNRNGRFDDTDYEPWKRGRFGTNSVGDPQWIGMLEHADMSHSPSNRFLGRYAFVVLPTGKTLDLNFMYNNAKERARAGFSPGFYSRNQGVGSWELNLAAFLTDLNTNFWRSPGLGVGAYNYNPAFGASTGYAFDDASSILRYRYAGSLGTLKPLNQLVSVSGANASVSDLIDGYSDGPAMLGTRLVADNDDPSLPWSGSDSTNGYFGVEELFDASKTSATFVNRLRFALADNVIPYNYNTFSRLLAEIGTDSLPANRRKLNLNYVNVDTTGVIIPQLVTNAVPWTPIRFFTNAGNLLLQRQFGPDIPINRIPLWPTNLYTASVHRMLQLAANIWDGMTNGVALAPNLYAPTIFRPLLGRQNTNIFIIGFQEVTNDLPLRDGWINLNIPTGQNGDLGRDSIRENTTNFLNVYGLPWVIGAKKGFPNFNEYYLQTSAQVTRRLQAERPNQAANPIFRQAYELGISNYFGLESWNSYLQAYPLELEMRLTNRSFIRLNFGTNTAAPPIWPTRLISNGFSTNIPAMTWSGEQFRTPLANQIIYLPDSQFSFLTMRFSPATATNVSYENVSGYPVPDWKLYVTNRFQFVLIDRQKNRIVDFVNLDNLVGNLDITKALVGTTNLFQGPTSREASFWLTNRIANQMAIGISNQIFASVTNLLSDAEWRSLSLNPVTGQQKEKAIDGFRQFLGLPPLFSATNPAVRGRFAQVPFTPTRKMDLKMSWQANDPLVHYHIEDLYDPFNADTNNVQILPPGGIPKPSNLGQLNLRYRPWGGRPGSSVQNFDPAIQDPLVRRSDDWDFPTNKFPNIGWLGRVHRGTPWQTVYLKSPVAPVADWAKWAGRADTHPTNDWWILDLFTTAMNDNAARGLLSVNQTNVAAWSAVLSGVSVLTNSRPANPGGGPLVYSDLLIQPASPQLLTIVSNINVAKLQQPNQTFRTLGHVLAAPALTVASPFLNTADPGQAQFGISDAAYERIPQQVLSLLKEDEAYVTIYAFGQSLKPADRSVVTAPGVYHNLCTNYQITGEVVTKTVLRFLESRQQNRPSTYKAVVESYNVVPTD